jgi:prepilin-type N-terminal cleavage/methylation domain-containing protein
MKNRKNYKAFSLIEILLSIVILGIIASVFPFILQSVTKTAKVSVKEETVYNELSLLKLILPYYFDENNNVDDNFYKDLNASNGDEELLINYNSSYTGDARIGKSEFNNNVLRSGSNLDVSEIGIDDGEVEGVVETYDDIDDFNGYEVNVSNHTLKISIYYIDDNTNYSDENITFTFDYDTKKNKTNIKFIKITSDNNITLYYPTCNIGGSKYLSLGEISR